MLNYKNDSLLLGKETVNDLIRKDKEDMIFLDKERKILNVYSAFVKKCDFQNRSKRNQPFQKTVYAKVSHDLSDRILKRFPNEKIIIKKLETYIDRRSNLKKAIKRWFKKGIFPLILLRVTSEDYEEFAAFIKEVEYFTDFLGKSRFICPKFIDELLDKKIVYFIGCSVGDGHINKEGKRWTLVDGSSKKERLIFSKKFVLNLANLIKNFVDIHEIRDHPTKCVLRVNSKLFCRFLNFFFGLPFGKKKDVVLEVPYILRTNGDYLEKYFWKGCFDTDGSVIKQGAIDFCSIDKNLIKECIKYLKKQSIQAKETKRGLSVGGEYLTRFSDVGFSHPRKQLEFTSVLKRIPKYTIIRMKEGKKVNNELLRLYKIIRVDSNNYRIRIHYRNMKKFGISESEIRNKIKNLFGYKLKKTNNLLYFKSKRIYMYLTEIFSFEPLWKPINTNEETKLLNKWNEVWS